MNGKSSKMTSIDKYLEIIKKGISNREVLMAMEPLANIEDLAPLLDEKLTYKEFIDINRLLRQKYIVENPEDMLKDVDFNQLSLPSNTRTLYLMGSKSDVIDFSKYEHVEKILVVGARRVRKIILPQNDCVKALGISSMTNLESIENISIQTDMRYLHFDFGVKLPNFDFIRDLNQLLYLSFTANKKLPELDFIQPSSELRFLDFVDTNIFKYASTVSYLKYLKHLRFLTTGRTNQKQREFLRSELPHICMRED